MTQEEYLSQRVEPDLAWYDKRAGQYRKLHFGARISIIVFSALITILTSVEFKYKNTAIAVLGALVVIITSISELMKFKDQWFEYRNTAETIKSEKVYFLTGTEPYKNEADSFNTFVKNYETIIRTEHQNWRSLLDAKVQE